MATSKLAQKTAPRVKGKAVPAAGRVYGGRSATERRADRRERLLEAAFDLFGTAGFSATSISSLCAASGVTERHFYEEFESREALLAAVYDGIVERVFHAVQDALKTTGMTQVQRIAAANLAYFRYLTSDVRRARIYALEAVGINPDLERYRRDTRQKFVRSITRGLERLAESGVAVGIDYHLASAALAGASHELLLEFLLSPKKMPVELLAETIATLWIRTLQLDPAGEFTLH